MLDYTFHCGIFALCTVSLNKRIVNYTTTALIRVPRAITLHCHTLLEHNVMYSKQTLRMLGV